MRATPEHPFAKFIQALGRGPSLSRDLTEEEAREAMSMILRAEVEPVQLGAFLVLMRYKKETPAELAGFVRAARAAADAKQAPARADLDWPSYADKHRQLGERLHAHESRPRCARPQTLSEPGRSRGRASPHQLRLPGARGLLPAARRTLRPARPPRPALAGQLARARAQPLPSAVSAAGRVPSDLPL